MQQLEVLSEITARVGRREFWRRGPAEERLARGVRPIFSYLRQRV
jgi:hypothetical protein